MSNKRGPLDARHAAAKRSLDAERRRTRATPKAGGAPVQKASSRPRGERRR